MEVGHTFGISNLDLNGFKATKAEVFKQGNLYTHTTSVSYTRTDAGVAPGGATISSPTVTARPATTASGPRATP